MNDIWNVVLYKLNGNTLISSKNNPTKSGRYLCTCVQMWQGEEQKRYLQVMEYDASKNHWHDCGNESGISHNILAWTDKIIPCDFTDFDYYRFYRDLTIFDNRKVRRKKLKFIKKKCYTRISK